MTPLAVRLTRWTLCKKPNGIFGVCGLAMIIPGYNAASCGVTLPNLITDSAACERGPGPVPPTAGNNDVIRACRLAGFKTVTALACTCCGGGPPPAKAIRIGMELENGAMVTAPAHRKIAAAVVFFTLALHVLG